MESKSSVQHHNGDACHKPPVHNHGGGRRGGRQQGGGKQGIKVVSISSPMMLTASAEEFRAVVQELTGRDSNVADHDLAHHAGGGAPSSSSSNNSWSSSSYYSSFGRASPTTTAAAAAAGASALPQTMATAGPGRPAEYAAAQPSFQGMYDQAAGSLLYGQEYW